MLLLKSLKSTSFPKALQHEASRMLLRQVFKVISTLGQ
jgi:hypothetical protein